MVCRPRRFPRIFQCAFSLGCTQVRMHSFFIILGHCNLTGFSITSPGANYQNILLELHPLAPPGVCRRTLCGAQGSTMEHIRHDTRQLEKMLAQGGSRQTTWTSYSQVWNHDFMKHGQWLRASFLHVPRFHVWRKTLPVCLFPRPPLHFFFQIPVSVGCIAQEDSHRPKNTPLEYEHHQKHCYTLTRLHNWLSLNFATVHWHAIEICRCWEPQQSTLKWARHVNNIFQCLQIVVFSQGNVGLQSTHISHRNYSVSQLSSNCHVSTGFSQISFPITVLPKDDRTDFAQEERQGLRHWTMTLAICELFDESQCPDIPIWEFSISCGASSILTWV